MILPKHMLWMLTGSSEPSGTFKNLNIHSLFPLLWQRGKHKQQASHLTGCPLILMICCHSTSFSKNLMDPLFLQQLAGLLCREELFCLEHWCHSQQRLKGSLVLICHSLVSLCCSLLSQPDPLTSFLLQMCLKTFTIPFLTLYELLLENKLQKAYQALADLHFLSNGSYDVFFLARGYSLL